MMRRRASRLDGSWWLAAASFEEWVKAHDLFGRSRP
jgi:hypothetical protein